MGAHKYGLDGGYEVHGQRRKERVANGSGVLMNGNGQHLQTEGRVYGDNSDVIVRTSMNLSRMETMYSEFRLQGLRGGQFLLPSPYSTSPPPAQTAFSLNMGPLEHLMMILMNHGWGTVCIETTKYTTS